VISVENRRIFPPNVFNAPAEGFPRNWVSAQGVKKAQMMGLPDGRKSSKIGLVV